MNHSDIFLCYRRAGAQTAKLFKRYLIAEEYPGKVWYSDEEIHGNYKNDIPDVIGSSECAVLFVDRHFTKGFLDSDDYIECITALEIVQIEKRIQADPHFRMLIVTLDCQGFSVDSQKVLEQLFKKHSIYTEASVSHFSQCNTIQFNTARDDEDILFRRLSEELLADSFFREHPIQGNFYFGKRPTMADMIVWDTENGIDCADIAFELTTKNIPLHRKIKSIRYDEKAELQNNQMVCLTGLNVSLSDDEERKQLSICYQLIEYRLFHKTLQIWNHPTLNLNRMLMLYSSEKDVYSIPNAMGMAFMVVTADNQLIFTRRSSKRAIRPNEYDCSIVEGLKHEVYSDVHGSYDIDNDDYIFREIHRAYREEICAADQDIRIKVNGIVLDKEYGQWNIIGTIFTASTAEELFRKHALRDDTFEYIHMEKVPLQNADGVLTLDALQTELKRYLKGKVWGMALATLYATLRNLGFSESDIDAMNV